jgi:AhpC/TSA family protein
MGKRLLMTTSTSHVPQGLAPELAVHSWFNTDRPLPLSVLRGRVVVLAAFQVLCPHSVASGVPQAQRIFETFAPADVTVIGLHATFEHHDAFHAAVLKAFIHEYRLKFPIALDQPNNASPIPQTMERYKMRGTPSLVLIDRHGIVRKHAFGAVDDLRLGAEIGALTQERQSTELARSTAA